MFSRFGNYIYNSISTNSPRKNDEYSDAPPLKFKYTRPAFLHRNTDDEVEVSADHVTRPVMLPRSIRALPWFTGYAEAINAGKSQRNEDQAAYTQDVLRSSHPVALKKEPLPVTPETTEVKSVKSDIEIVNEHPEESISATDDQAPKPDQSCPEAEEEGFSVLDETVSEELRFTTPLSTPELRRKFILDNTIPWVYFALFDGHAGSGVAVAASNTLHLIIQEKLQSIADLLTLTNKQLNFVAKGLQEKTIPQPAGFQGFSSSRDVTPETLIVGALESAFHEMDRRIAIDKKHYTMTGGCTALVALFMFGKLYLANAGDSRAVICRGLKPVPMSYDFTPETERNRLRKLGQMKPELLGNEFTHLDFVRRLARKDLGEKILYRDAYMSGWCYKSVAMEDLKFPLIYGEGKRSRLLATIGVTRGFGDHDLKALDTDIDIKPFLSCEPEVIIFNLLEEDLTDDDVLVMGTDGLWDVTSNEKAAECVHKVFENLPDPTSDKYKCRYNLAAHDLVMSSRGKLRDRNWRTSDNKTATIDDISVFVIPLLPYKNEYLKWGESRNDLLEYRKSLPSGVQTL